MIYKTLAYVAIIVGGAISGGLAASYVGPIQILLSSGDTSVIGACLGAIAAIVGCGFAIEHHQAAERNREILRIVEGRVARVVQLRATLSR